ncbi:hypothetical protein VTN31DRAFT_2207 [Thermomyces dupontii]|uniref:uncharacterized protein n=1 Tax=Talaromyces thermophilus TaxID=28565 RepID=UPI003743297B
MPWSPLLPEHCAPESDFLRFLSSTLHVCLPSALALISSSFGVLSILCWLFAQLPQIYKNYRLQSTEGLSIFFLVEWCLGDTAHLLGALFTHQAAWQVVIAAYYVSVDITLVVQYFWYTYLAGTPRRKGKSGTITSSIGFGGDDGEVIEGITPLLGSLNNDESLSEGATRSEPKDVGVTKKPVSETPAYSPSYSSYNANEKRKVGNVVIREGSRGSLRIVSPKTVVLTTMLCAVVARAAPSPSSSTPPSLDNAPPLTSGGPSAIETAGQIVSWLSTLLYLGSRLPQLYKNYVRKSTSGLSPLLFLAAFSGNFFYSASLLTNPKAWSDLPPYGGGGWADENGSQRDEWILLATPFFLGAAGVLSLDALMGVQFLIYSANRPDDNDSNTNNNSVPYIGLQETSSTFGRRWSRLRTWFSGTRRREKYPASDSGGLLPARTTTGYGTV